jgi:release factor glutamine methyltransferase
VTTAYSAARNVHDIEGVYPPQEDSQLLIDTLRETGLAQGRRVLDLCTGSGVVAIAAAESDAASVVAFDICPRAVGCTQGNAANAGVSIDVLEGSWSRALDYAPFDLIVSNPPYVPTPPAGDTDVIPLAAGPARAWNAGVDGRMVLDPLCESAAGLLDAGGSLLMVHSTLSGVDKSLESLRATGLNAEVVAAQTIPFGPVLSARAGWLEVTGQIKRGCRTEGLVVIRADKP